MMPAVERSKKGFSFREAIIIIAVIVFVLILPGLINAFNNSRDHAKASEAKANLHNIQLMIERYAVDKIQYPPYLIGGTRSSFVKPAESGSSSRLETDPTSDPLLREGYLDSYPRNPFVLRGENVLEAQRIFGDGLGPGLAGSQGGYRFGADGKVMGNIMADIRYVRRVQEGASENDDRNRWFGGEFSNFGYGGRDRTWADVNYYQYYFEERQSKRQTVIGMPGQFFYKSMGPVVFHSTDDPMGIVIPIERDRYMVGLLSTGGRGNDILGPEPLVQVIFKGGHNGDNELQQFRAGTGQESGWPSGGSPFGPLRQGEDISNQVTMGNSDGISDSVGLALKWAY